MVSVVSITSRSFDWFDNGIDDGCKRDGNDGDEDKDDEADLTGEASACTGEGLFRTITGGVIIGSSPDAVVAEFEIAVDDDRSAPPEEGLTTWKLSVDVDADTDSSEPPDFPLAVVVIVVVGINLRSLGRTCTTWPAGMTAGSSLGVYVVESRRESLVTTSLDLRKSFIDILRWSPLGFLRNTSRLDASWTFDCPPRFDNIFSFLTEIFA